MYCLFSLPRASSIAVYSWILESVSIKYPEYKECADVLLGTNNAHIFKSVSEMFEEQQYSDKMYVTAKQSIRTRDNLEQSLLPENYWYSDTLYYHVSKMSPTPIVSIKVGKNYNTLNRFVNDPKYTTITLARRDIRQQFLSFIVATQSQTFHGNPDKIYQNRKRMRNIYVTEDMFIIWFDWLCKLHRAKQITDYTLYIEDYMDNPAKLLNELDLPELVNYSRLIQKTKDTNFDAKIENLDEFNKHWNKYCSIYKDIL